MELVDKFSKILARRAFSKMRAEFYEDMSSSLRAGNSMNQVIQTASKRVSNKGNIRLAMLYSSWVARLSDHSLAGSFAEAVRRDVPESDYMILSGFEKIGKLADGLSELSSIIYRSEAITKTLKGAIFEPMFAIFSILGAAYFFGGDIMTTMSRIAPVEKWPLTGYLTYYFSTFVNHYIFLVVLLVIGLFWLFGWSLSNWASPLRRKLDNHFPYATYRDFRSASFLLVLSPLLRSGLSLDQTLRTLGRSGGPWMAMYLNESVRRMGDMKMMSEDQAAPFDVGLFRDRVFWRMQDAVQRGGIADSINTIALNSFLMLSDIIDLQAKVINKMSMAIAGLVLALMAAGLTFTGLNLKDMMGMKI